jgi:hypothetical protein
MFCADRQSAEKDVADDLCFDFGDKQYLHMTIGTQGIDKIGFQIRFEGRPVHVPDLGFIVLSFVTNDHECLAAVTTGCSVRAFTDPV